MHELISWQGLIGAILGACLAVLGSMLTNRANLKQLRIRLKHEERVHRKRLSKERLEELT